MYTNNLSSNTNKFAAGVYYGVYYINKCISVKIWDINRNLIFWCLGNKEISYPRKSYPLVIYIQSPLSSTTWYNGFLIDTINPANLTYLTYKNIFGAN
jgi:hypothetical protein